MKACVILAALVATAFAVSPPYYDCDACVNMFTDATIKVHTMLMESKDDLQYRCTRETVVKAKALTDILAVELSKCDADLVGQMSAANGMLLKFLKHICQDDVHNKDFCTQKGNVYTPINDCEAFDQRPGYDKPADDELMITHYCPKGTLFDVNTCVCNHESLVKCGYVPYVPPKKTTPYKQSTPKIYTPEYTTPSYKNDGFCTAAGNVYTPINDCKAFDQRPGYDKPADDELMISHYCAEGTLFDVRICVCNHIGQVKCGDVPYVEPKKTTPYKQSTPKIYTPEYTTPSYKNDGFCTQKGNVYTPINDCKAFDHRPGYDKPADEDLMISHYCAEGTLFDVRICVCNYADQVKCGDVPYVEPKKTTPYKQSTPKSYTPEYTTPSYKNDGFCTQKGNVYTPINDCKAFDQRPGYDKPADGHLMISHYCPEGTLFDVNVCVCNHDYLVKCGNVPYVSPKKTTPYQVTTPKQYKTTSYSKDGSCTERGNVYTPINGCKAFDQRPGYKRPADEDLMITHYCPTDTLFDIRYCVCNHAYEVECGDVPYVPAEKTPAYETTTPKQYTPVYTTAYPSEDYPQQQGGDKYRRVLESLVKILEGS